MQILYSFHTFLNSRNELINTVKKIMTFLHYMLYLIKKKLKIAELILSHKRFKCNLS